MKNKEMLVALSSSLKNAPKSYQYLLRAFCLYLVVLIMIAVLFDSEDSYFVGNIVPELIGFGLEGLFFICLFSIYSFNVEKKKSLLAREEGKRLILGLVNDYTSHVGKLIQPGATFNLSVPMMRESICSLIIEKWNKNEETKKEIYLLTKAFLPIFNLHVDTAYRIDKEHAESWQHLVIYLNYFVNDPTEAEAWDAFVKAINELKEWDDLQIGGSMVP
ncbi:hypothetical protein [Photobacterium swingsii]|uniref:hypothetical protein n=1 Tax=Photobacterium swingsii TaxID=680026 RepID=UPI00406759C0